MAVSGPKPERQGARDQRFRPGNRIRKRPEFKRVYERGTRISGRYMTAFVLPRSSGGTRLGITASRKLGGAVRRNRAKRLVREVFRRLRNDADLDIVIHPRHDLTEAALAALEADFRSILRRTRSLG